MKRSARWLVAVSAITMSVMGAQAAQAAGTSAGTTITNTVTVDYKVGSIAQTTKTATNSFKVDRKVNVLVETQDSTTVQVTPGQTQVATKFKVSNLSNAALDFALSSAQLTGTTAKHGGTDTFDVTITGIYLDSNGSGVFDSGDQAVTYLDELAADGSKIVFVVANVPLGLGTGDVAGVTLKATGREGGTAGSMGAALSETSSSNPMDVETVFGDSAGAADAARDAAHSDGDDYTVLAAALTVAKTSRVVSDPVNGTSSPKAIPGAVIEYCIAVSNGAGSAAANTVTVNDPVPANMTYDSSFGIKVNGSVDASGVCSVGTAGGTYASNTVSGSLSNLAAGDTKTLYFRAVID
ncbi:MAG: hypothetical protein RL702_2824 [Pseudomonadota bacterium]